MHCKMIEATSSFMISLFMISLLSIHYWIIMFKFQFWFFMYNFMWRPIALSNYRSTANCSICSPPVKVNKTTNIRNNMRTAPRHPQPTDPSAKIWKMKANKAHWNVGTSKNMTGSNCMLFLMQLSCFPTGSIHGWLTVRSSQMDLHIFC